ncbi:hypothetical protein ACH36K_12400 [Clostridium sp. MB05]|uniref:hypothetical protein n=1 Tax=Clostridium sp. MB05 TaxID=3376682 RepID=UPI0039828F04
MKNYLLNKDFIPIEYIKQRNEKINKINKRSILILILLNIMIFPSCLNKLMPKEETVKIDKDLNKEVGIKVDNIEKCINIINPDILSMQIQNNKGVIEIKTKNKIYEIESTEEIKINSMTKGEKDTFILGVNL